MVYDFFVWLLKGGITALIVFLPVQPVYHDGSLVIEAQLAHSITPETLKLARKGFVFGIDYYCTIIINDAKTHSATDANRASYGSNGWSVNGGAANDSLAERLQGRAVFTFNTIRFKDGDELFVYIKASIAPDSVFTASTGLKTGILWNYYEPRCKRKFIFKQGAFVDD